MTDETRVDKGVLVQSLAEFAEEPVPETSEFKTDRRWKLTPRVRRLLETAGVLDAAGTRCVRDGVTAESPRDGEI